MKTIFLSHDPHEAHLAFARAVGARVRVLPLKKYVLLSKQIPLVGYLIPFLSFLLSLTISSDEEMILVEGGTSLYTSVFLKWRNRKTKIIYMDVDLLFYDMRRKGKGRFGLIGLFTRQIDAVISDSNQNREFVPEYLQIPKHVCVPFPKKIRKNEGVRKSYGLYIGRLDPDKNIKRIISFGLQCPYFEKFIIIGDGAQRKYVEAISSKNRKLSYLGPQKDVEKYYNMCKFLVHIPDSDPHPCTTMEAALGGCFPLISKSTGTAYLFDDMFIVENPNNFKEINLKIKNILDNEKRAKKLLCNATKNFPTREKSVERFRNVFEKIVAEIGK